MYAVVATGGKQYKVSEGDRLEVEKLQGDPGSQIVLDKVLMLRGDKNVTVGKPYVEGGSVLCSILGRKKGRKTLSFKMKKRKGYRRRVGHRQEYTLLEVKEIKGA